MGCAKPIAAALLRAGGAGDGVEGITPRPSSLLLLQSESDATLELAAHHQNSTITPEAVLASLRLNFRFSLNAACACIVHRHGLCLNNPEKFGNMRVVLYFFAFNKKSAALLGKVKSV